MNSSTRAIRFASSAAAMLVTMAASASDTAPQRFAGVDLSYVNEVEACGAQYRFGGQLRDPYELFAERGANLVRLRLWNDPTWTNYSTEADVTRSMERAKKAGMHVLLDFHYSDDWADPQKQTIPAAWAARVAEMSSWQLGESKATVSWRPTPTSLSRFAIRFTLARSSANVSLMGSCQRSVFASTAAAVRSGQSRAARHSSSYVDAGSPRSERGVLSMSTMASGLEYRGQRVMPFTGRPSPSCAGAPGRSSRRRC